MKQSKIINFRATVDLMISKLDPEREYKINDIDTIDIVFDTALEATIDLPPGEATEAIRANLREKLYTIF